MKKLILLLFIVAGCYKQDYTPVELNGEYINSELTLIFEDGLISGQSECNDLYGRYTVLDDSINIHISSTKVGCANDFDRYYLNGKYIFSLNGGVLKIYGSDYLIELYSKN